MSFKNVLVLGGTGFLGRTLQDHKKDWIYLGRNYFVENGVKCGIDPINFTSYEDSYEIIKDFAPDAIVNLTADVGGILYNKNNKTSIFENNILISTNILKAAKELEVERVLSALSTCIFPQVSDGEYPLGENDWMNVGSKVLPYEGHKGYAWSKRMLQIHTELCRSEGYNYSTFTPSNLYGPYDNFGEVGHFVASLVKKIYSAKDGGVITLYGDGTPLRQFLFSQDLALIIPRLLTDHNSGEPIIVAPEENLSIDEMAKMAIEVSGKELSIVYTKEHQGQTRKDCKNTGLKNLIGYDINFTPFMEGVEKTYRWWQDEQSV